MDIFSPKHLLILLVVVLLVFGTKKLRTIGPDLGNAIRGFKDSMKEGERESDQPPPPAPLEARQIPAQPAQPAQSSEKAQTSEKSSV